MFCCLLFIIKQEMINSFARLVIAINTNNANISNIYTLLRRRSSHVVAASVSWNQEQRKKKAWFDDWVLVFLLLKMRNKGSPTISVHALNIPPALLVFFESWFWRRFSSFYQVCVRSSESKWLACSFFLLLFFIVLYTKESKS